MSDLPWFVAHTQPRCEKKLMRYREREGLSATLPTYKAAHKYRRKTVVFEKPLFPGYVFLQISDEQRGKVFQSDCLANLLVVVDQELFIRQLGEILCALDTGLEIRLAPVDRRGDARENQEWPAARNRGMGGKAPRHEHGSAAAGFYRAGRSGEDGGDRSGTDLREECC